MPHRVLIVDDEPHVLEMISNSLADEPYTLITAQSADEALSILARGPVDLILADEVMPGASGSELLAIVRREYPDIIRMLFTAHASLELAIRAINEGRVFHFFTKPLRLTDLIMTVRQALRHKDFMVESRRILGVVRKQYAILRRLERKHPGITRVERNEDGAVIIDDTNYVSWHELVEEMYKEVERSEEFFQGLDIDTAEEE